MRGWIPGLLIAAGAAVFLIWGSLAEPGPQPRLEQRTSTVLEPGDGIDARRLTAGAFYECAG